MVIVPCHDGASHVGENSVVEGQEGSLHVIFDGIYVSGTSFDGELYLGCEEMVTKRMS